MIGRVLSSSPYAAGEIFGDLNAVRLGTLYGISLPMLQMMTLG